MSQFLKKYIDLRRRINWNQLYSRYSVDDRIFILMVICKGNQTTVVTRWLHTSHTSQMTSNSTSLSTALDNFFYFGKPSQISDIFLPISANTNMHYWRSITANAGAKQWTLMLTFLFIHLYFKKKKYIYKHYTFIPVIIWQLYEVFIFLENICLEKLKRNPHYFIAEKK